MLIIFDFLGNCNVFLHDNHKETILKTTSIPQVHSKGVNFSEVVFYHSSKRENERKQKRLITCHLKESCKSGRNHGNSTLDRGHWVTYCVFEVSLCNVYACVPYSSSDELLLCCLRTCCGDRGKRNWSDIKYVVLSIGKRRGAYY